MLFSFLSLAVLRIVHAAYLTLTTLRGLGRRLQNLTFATPLPSRAPKHVGIVVGAVDPLLGDLPQLTALIGWIAAAGVRCVTLCDAHGDLMRATAQLRAALADGGLGGACVLEPGELPHDAAMRGTGLAVRVVSLHTGRDDITVAARHLCEQVRVGHMSAAAIDEKVVEGELRANAGFPEPVRAPPAAACLGHRRCSPLFVCAQLTWCAHARDHRSWCCSAAQRSTWAACCRGTAA